MPVRGLLDVKGAAFDPEDITVITAAHEIVLEQLNVADRKSPLAFLIAKTVIQIAKSGERDPRLLSERVIQALQSPRGEECRPSGEWTERDPWVNGLEGD
jgi:hypothetical protein